MDFWTCFEVWEQFHLGMGLPYPGTWAQQPLWVNRILKAFTLEFKQYENEQHKKRMEASAPKSKKKN